MLETALDAGISPETLREIETGRVAIPAFPTIAAIADVIGLSLDAVWAEIQASNVRPEGATPVTARRRGWSRKSRSHSGRRFVQPASGRARRGPAFLWPVLERVEVASRRTRRPGPTSCR